MAYSNHDKNLTDDQLAQVKDQIASVVKHMSRLQIFEIADFLYAEARSRRSEDTLQEDWCFEIRI